MVAGVAAGAVGFVGGIDECSGAKLVGACTKSDILHTRPTPSHCIHGCVAFDVGSGIKMWHFPPLERGITSYALNPITVYIIFKPYETATSVKDDGKFFLFNNIYTFFPIGVVVI